MSRNLSTTDFVVRIDECQNCPVLIDMEVQIFVQRFRPWSACEIRTSRRTGIPFRSVFLFWFV